MKAVIVGAALLISTAAFAQSLGEKTGINSVLGIAPGTQDFVNEAAMAGLFEIESSKLAMHKTEGPLKDFATQLVADHTKAGEELASEAKAENFTVPSALDPVTQEKINQMDKLNTANFSKEYAHQQVLAHRDAVSLFERYAKGGDNVKLKTFAVATLPTLQHHLNVALLLDH
jgi:putative membrane protein